jgi:hypothetical protein
MLLTPKSGSYRLLKFERHILTLAKIKKVLKEIS